ncbi:MAG: dihydrofolate reductase family protein [Pseudomonadota bacterium]
MRKLAVLTFVSLDGVMQGPSHADEDRSNDFDVGGWAAPWWEPVMEDVRASAMATNYDLLLGRKTYELFAGHWSSNTDTSPEATRMNEATKFVVTRDGVAATWSNSTVLTGDAAAEVRALKQTDGQLLQVHGSWDLIQTLAGADLIDEYRLWVFPVVVGQGKRLFPTQPEPRQFEPVSQAVLKCGVVRSFFKPNG